MYYFLFYSICMNIIYILCIYIYMLIMVDIHITHILHARCRCEFNAKSIGKRGGSSSILRSQELAAQVQFIYVASKISFADTPWDCDMLWHVVTSLYFICRRPEASFSYVEQRKTDLKGSDPWRARVESCPPRYGTCASAQARGTCQVAKSRMGALRPLSFMCFWFLLEVFLGTSWTVFLDWILHTRSVFFPLVFFPWCSCLCLDPSMV